MCGGTQVGVAKIRRNKGLSPRVRGNLPIGVAWTCRRRTIPACAGEPVYGRRVLEGTADYPRVCGGTESEADKILDAAGLSPRVRGNRCILGTTLFQQRTIPACAGEPTKTQC